MNAYKIPSASETQGSSLISSLLLVQSGMTFVFIFIVSVVLFLVKGFFFTRKTLKSSEDQEEQSNIRNVEVKTKEDLILDGLRNPSQFIFESFGFNKFLTVALYIFRCIVCCWIVGTIISTPFVRSYGSDNVLLKLSTYFTQHMVLVQFTYFSSQTLFGLFYLIMFRDFSVKFSSLSTSVLKKRNKWMVITLRFISSIIWIVGELNLVASLVVSIGYWFAKLGEREKELDYLSVANHGVTGLLSVIDFLLSNFQFRKWHVFTIMCFPSLYFVWMLSFTRNLLVSEFPYSVVNYYLKPWYTVILILFGIYFVLGLSFMAACLITYLRNKLLVRYFINKEKKSTTTPVTESLVTTEEKSEITVSTQQPDSSTTSGSVLSVMKQPTMINHGLNQLSCNDIRISVSMIEMTENISSSSMSSNSK